jgi:ADP-heptose:LPS heptosyltransferase
MRVGSLGDHLVALPLYRRLRERHPGAQLLLVANLPATGNRKLVGPGSVLPPGLFDDMLAYPAAAGVRGALAAWRMFRSARLDRLYYLMPARSAAQLRRDRWFFAALGIDVVGLREFDGRILPAGEAGLYRHEADRLAAAIPGIDPGLGARQAYRSLGLDDHELAAGRERLQGRATIALSMGTKCEVNDWGIAQWERLVELLGEQTTVGQLVLLGAPDEHAAAERLRLRWPRAVQNLCGVLSPRQSGAVLAAAALYIGHDSGPMHLAASVDAPIVAVFSARNLPGTWFPLSPRQHIHYTTIDCMGCGRWHCDDRRKACITAISPEAVADSCLAMLTGPPA